MVSETVVRTVVLLAMRTTARLVATPQEESNSRTSTHASAAYRAVVGEGDAGVGVSTARLVLTLYLWCAGEPR